MSVSVTRGGGGHRSRAAPPRLPAELCGKTGECAWAIQLISSRRGPPSHGWVCPGPQLPGDGGVVSAGGSCEVLMQVCPGVQNVHLIILILTEAGRVRIGQQDEFSEAVEVGNTAESLQHQHHGNKAQEEVCCRHGGGETGKWRAGGNGSASSSGSWAARMWS